MEYTFSNKIGTLKPSAIREILKYASNPEIIPFAAGNPAAESFPISQMAEISAEIYEKMPVQAFQYSITEGYAPLIDKVSKRLKEKFNIGKEFDSTIIVSGGQQGLDLTCKVLCNEGDTVLCESPSFIGALNAFRAYNTNLKGIELEDDGINIEKLENALKTEKNVKLIYLIPTFQNPTGKTMSLEKRKAVYRLAKKYSVIILEDNPYGELRFKGQEIPTIKTMDTEGIVVYCGSFSKILSAGIRLGFMNAPSAIISKIVVAKQVNDVHTNIFFQILANNFIEKFDFDEHILKIKKLYGEKCALMLGAIDKNFDKRVKVTRPEGGLFLWCEMPAGTNIFELAKKALDVKVAIVPGSAFIVDENEPCYSFRLNYSTPSNDQIVKGIELLSGQIDKFLSAK